MLQRTSVLLPEFTSETRPMPVPPKTKAWLPAARRVGVDAREVDAVAAGDPDALEGGDAAARPDDVARARRRVGNGVEVEDISAETTGQNVGPPAATQNVVAFETDDEVSAISADQQVVAAEPGQIVPTRAADDRIGLRCRR